MGQRAGVVAAPFECAWFFGESAGLLGCGAKAPSAMNLTKPSGVDMICWMIGAFVFGLTARSTAATPH